MSLAKKSKVIVGVSGGISAYKACEFVRLCKKAGYSVRVVMTADAERFVGALTFHSLSGEPVLRSLHEGVSDLSATSHIDLAQWGDALVVVPATANTMAKLAHGFASDALATEALAFQGPILLAAAMNARMWNAEATQQNFEILKGRGMEFVGPEVGDLACGEHGLGKMSEPQVIFDRLQEILESPKVLKGKKVLVTSGPTRSYLDPVRYLTNKSSGRMGHALALAAEKMGAQVVLVTGPVEERFASLPKGKVVKVETAQEMLEASVEQLTDAHLVVAAAAVADFSTQPSSKKIRREGKLQLTLDPGVDVLAELGKRKVAGQIFVGFAAETGEGEEEFAKARTKMKAKNLDFLALNNVARKDIGFDVEENEVHWFSSKTDRIERFQRSLKKNIAREILTRALIL